MKSIYHRQERFHFVTFGHLQGWGGGEGGLVQGRETKFICVNKISRDEETCIATKGKLARIEVYVFLWLVPSASTCARVYAYMRLRAHALAFYRQQQAFEQ